MFWSAAPHSMFLSQLFLLNCIVLYCVVLCCIAHHFVIYGVYLFEMCYINKPRSWQRNLPFALRNVTEGLGHPMNESPLRTGQGGGKFHFCSVRERKRKKIRTIIPSCSHWHKLVMGIMTLNGERSYDAVSFGELFKRMAYLFAWG